LSSEPSNKQISEWFGLNRDNYILNPREFPEDAAFYARRIRSLDIDEQISRLEVDLEAKLTPKKIYWGPYGGGKTHTLYKIVHELNERLDIYPVFVECPTLKSSSTFAILYEKTMNQMGMDFVLDLLRNGLNDVARKTGLTDPEEAVKKLCALLGDDDLGRAVYQLTQPSTYFDPMVLWRWLTASGITSKDKNTLRVTSDLKTADPERLANILLTIGKLLTRYKDKTLVLIYDELDRASVLGKDPVVTFSTAFTTLTDLNQTNVAVFLATSAARIADVPGIITQPVKSRVGSEDLKEIPPMVTDDIEPFVKDLITHNRKKDITIDNLVKKAKTLTKETVELELYPFTKEAIEAIKVKLGRNMYPRDITRIMSRSASYAKNKMSLNIITTKAIEDS
jgi:hypothetical protein